MHRMSRPRELRIARQRGVTLLEILIAVLVLSIGLLGMAALQGVSLQTNSSAYYRSQATALAYDMADRMRANRAAALNGAYGLAYNDGPPAGSSVPATDMADWVLSLGTALPGGTGRIACVGSCASGVVTIGVEWDDTRGETGRDPDAEPFRERFEMTTQL